jgi:hypothetical protein
MYSQQKITAGSTIWQGPIAGSGAPSSVTCWSTPTTHAEPAKPGSWGAPPSKDLTVGCCLQGVSRKCEELAAKACMWVHHVVHRHLSIELHHFPQARASAMVCRTTRCATDRTQTIHVVHVYAFKINSLAFLALSRHLVHPQPLGAGRHWWAWRLR